MAGPPIAYAQNAGVSIAYQVFGSGPRDLVFVCGTMSHLDLFWSDPRATKMLEGLARFSRVILFDKPGTGLSDPIPAAPTAEQRAADVLAVMDAVGSERAVLVGYSEGGVPAQWLAATQPHRVEALVLAETMATMTWAPEVGIARERFDHMWGVLEDAWTAWGEGRFMRALAPSWVGHPLLEPLLGAVERTCMSPGMARSVLQGYRGLDMREVVPHIRVPTLVVHAPEDFVAQEYGRDLARRIPGARFLELEGRDHLLWTDNAESFADVVEEFVTGRRSAPHDEDRVLTTVVFTDIVDSTRQVAALGDARWRALLADLDRCADELLRRFDGIAVKHTGDGRFAHFARPARAVRFAVAMTEAARATGLELRAGVHTGECEAVGDDLIGLAVNIGARIAALGGPGDVLVSSTVQQLVVGSGLELTPWGERELKGVPGSWAIFRCASDRPGPLVSTGYETDVRYEL